VGQKPFCKSIGTLVVRIAVELMINKGITANRVTNPRMTKMPHAISKTPTNGARNSGFGSPDLLKAANSKFTGIKKFLNSFGQKNGPNHQSNDEGGDMPASLDDSLNISF
jgi:hypothetical protein